MFRVLDSAGSTVRASGCIFYFVLESIRGVACPVITVVITIRCVEAASRMKAEDVVLEVHSQDLQSLF